MKREEAREIIGRIQYKPDFMIGVSDRFDHFNETISLHLAHRVPCVYTSKPIQVASGHMLDVHRLDEKGLLLRMRDFIWGLERHEADEWFTYGGIRLYDPHKGSQ